MHYAEKVEKNIDKHIHKVSITPNSIRPLSKHFTFPFKFDVMTTQYMERTQYGEYANRSSCNLCACGDLRTCSYLQ